VSTRIYANPSIYFCFSLFTFLRSVSTECSGGLPSIELAAAAGCREGIADGPGSCRRSQKSGAVYSEASTLGLASPRLPREPGGPRETFVSLGFSRFPSVSTLTSNTKYETLPRLDEKGVRSQESGVERFHRSTGQEKCLDPGLRADLARYLVDSV
jgi:hypothetical protein